MGGRLPNERVEAAAKAALAHDFILELPQGYQTMSRSRTAPQRRAERAHRHRAPILKDSPILILDEATSEPTPNPNARTARAVNLMMGHGIRHRAPPFDDSPRG